MAFDENIFDAFGGFAIVSDVWDSFTSMKHSSIGLCGYSQLVSLPFFRVMDLAKGSEKWHA